MKLTDLVEMLTPGTVNIDWHDDVGVFVVGNTSFDATVRPARKDESQTFIPFFNTVPNVGNIDYGATGPDGIRTQDITGQTGKQTALVYSGAADVVRELIQRYNYEILLLIAKQTSSPTNYEDRVNHYSRMAYYAAKKFGMMDMCLASQPSFTVYVIFKPEHLNNLTKVKHHLEQQHNQTN